MKFPEIPVGKAFLIKGEHYTRVGPVTARRESDGSVRMIPRSTLVTPDVPDARGAGDPRSARPGWIDEALRAYERVLIESLAPDGGEPQRHAEVDSAIRRARQAFDRAASSTGPQMNANERK